MQVRAFPPHPSLVGLWSGESRLEVSGPEGERAKFTVALTKPGGGAALGRASFSSALPVGEDRWWELLHGSQRGRGLDDVVDQAEEIVVTVEHPTLGSSEIRARRPFEPMRWVTGHDRDGPCARLVNHTDDQPAIKFFPADQPAQCAEIPFEDDKAFRFDRAGLVLATCGDLEVATIIQPQVKGGLDALSRLNIRPTFQTGPRSLETVRRTLGLARRWGLPSDMDATGRLVQSRVLAAIYGRLGGLIGGPNWWEVEKAILDDRHLTLTLVRSGIGRGSEERGVAEGIFQRRRGGADLARLNDFYCDAMAVQCRWLDRDTARVVATIARAPETLSTDDPRVDLAIRAVFDRPAAFRVARVLAVAESLDIHMDEATAR
jgi:hypothetical protein